MLIYLCSFRCLGYLIYLKYLRLGGFNIRVCYYSFLVNINYFLNFYLFFCNYELENIFRIWL